MSMFSCFCASERVEQRFEEIESKFNDLRDQIDTIMAEKCLLEKQTQIDSEKFYDRIQDKDLKIECLECERNSIRDELQNCKEEYNKLKESYEKLSAKLDVQESADIEKLKQELIVKAHQLDDKNQLIEKLDKELQLKTHNLQKLVNTELWSKNKEIAKLHNHMTNLDENSSTQLNILIKELNDIGIQVKFTDDLVQLNYVNADTPIDIITITDYIQKLIVQKNDLEKEINYLKWLKIESRSSDDNASNTERNRKYCELLRTHLKDLIKFMKEMLKNTDQTEVVCNDQKKIVLDVLANSKILSDDFINALEEMALNELEGKANVAETIKKNEKLMIKSKSENTENKSQNSTPSDSEAFSEPDRVVSFARIGLPETKQKSINRNRTNKENKILSDSEDSMEYEKNNKSYQNDLTDFDANRQLLELQEINNFLHSELTILRKEMLQSTVDREIDSKIALLLSKLEKSQRYCEKLQITVEKKIHECSILKKQSKQNTVQKLQLEKKMLDAENMALESEQQKAELIQCIENVNKQSSNLNKENEMLKFKIIKLEEESETVRDTVLQLTKELDLLGLKHSQTLVDCTKLTNEKLRLEHDLRKSESRYEVAVRKLQEKFHKEVTDLNQINESHRARVKELEEVNKELRRHVVICEASDSAPSSSGISSIQPDLDMKHPFNDIPEYHAYNGSHWLPLTYPASSATRSKSSCSPDLGIESDAALTSTRPLKNTLKITESMTNLLSDDDNCNNNPGIVDTDTETPLPIEGLDEVEVLKQENEALKRRLMKTRKALEDTFQHLSTSNKNKKNVEKAITKQLMITKSILKKTRTYEDPTYEN